MDSLKNDIFVLSKVSNVSRVLLSHKKIEIILKRLASQLIEKFNDFDKVVLVGLQPRDHLLHRLDELLENNYGLNKVKYGKLDITFLETISDDLIKPYRHHHQRWL